MNVTFSEKERKNRMNVTFSEKEKTLYSKGKS